MRLLGHNLILSVSFAIVLLSGTIAHAASIRGLIDTTRGTLDLVIQTPGSKNAVFQLDATNPNIMGDLARLKQGDFLAARGTVDAINHTVHIESIESLGLAVLLGAWATMKLEVYEFEDFTKMNLYLPNSSRSAVIRAGVFNYAVAPDQGNRYTIFLSDDRSVTVGSIEFKNQRLKLTVLDPKTGRVSENISLSPLSVK